MTGVQISIILKYSVVLYSCVMAWTTILLRTTLYSTADTHLYAVYGKHQIIPADTERPRAYRITCAWISILNIIIGAEKSRLY